MSRSREAFFFAAAGKAVMPGRPERAAGKRIQDTEKKGRKNMKFMFASDLHGSAYYCEKLMEAIEKEQPRKVFLLGDLLYHGPRNDLPRDYAPKKVIAMLNGVKDRLLAIRGNCDTEVDQMVLEFPVLADYALFTDSERTFYLSHGHIYHEGALPPLQDGDIFVYGHTHVLRAEKKEGRIYLNPGSVSIPKEGNIPTYAVLEDGVFSIRGFDGTTVKELEL